MEKKRDPSLGTNYFSGGGAEGRLTKALVEIGSPVTIVSIDCLLEALFETYHYSFSRGLA